MTPPQIVQIISCIIYRQLIFSMKSDCLGCAVLLCLVCLFDLACFFLSSFSSLIVMTQSVHELPIEIPSSNSIVLIEIKLYNG